MAVRALSTRSVESDQRRAWSAPRFSVQAVREDDKEKRSRHGRMQGVVRVLPGTGKGSKSVGDVGGISMQERKGEGRGLWCVVQANVRDSEEG